jgi:hypothetical protein
MISRTPNYIRILYTAGAVSILLAGFSVTAVAAEPAADVAVSDDAQARAKQLFDSAMEDTKREDYRAACPKFRASYTINPKASTLLNLGTCFERNGQTASAWGAFSNAVIAARKTGHEDWAAQAEERVRVLEPRLARVVIRVARPASPQTSIEGLVVKRDGVQLTESELGLALALDPGPHTLTATAPDRLAWETKFQVVEGLPTPPVIEVPVLQPAPRTAQLPPAQPPRLVYFTPLRIAGVATAAVGVVSVGVGTVLTLLAKSRYDSAKTLCPQRDNCLNPVAVSDNASAFKLAGGATATMLIGGALAASGLAIVLLAPSKSVKAPTLGRAQVMPTAALSPDNRGMLSGYIGAVGTF